LEIKSEITALLGTDELVVLAVEDWSRQLALSHDIKKVGQLNETEKHAHYRAEEMDVSLARTVENLFGLLPEIRAERHAYFYDKEIRRERENHWEEIVEPHLAVEPDLVSLTWIQGQLRDVEHIIAARDNIVRDQGSDDILCSTHICEVAGWFGAVQRGSCANRKIHW
jgi:hypothetical protein